MIVINVMKETPGKRIAEWFRDAISDEGELVRQQEY